jgi:hypothetical protein
MNNKNNNKNSIHNTYSKALTQTYWMVVTLTHEEARTITPLVNPRVLTEKYLKSDHKVSDLFEKKKNTENGEKKDK